MSNLIESGISVILPAFNEESGIQSVLSELIICMTNSNLEYEIIVVNDGSEDNTGSIASSISNVRVVEHDKNCGYGASLKTGIWYAKYDHICITDADGTYPNERIPELFNHMLSGGFDMVVGARKLKDSSLIRRPAKWLIRKLAEHMTDVVIPDFNSGLRLFKKNIAKSFFSFLPDGFSFTTTITLAMLNNGYRVDFIAIEYFKRIGKSKIHPIKDTYNFVILVLRVSLYFKPLKVFMPMSMLLFFLSVLWGGFTYLAFGKLADVSTIVLFVGSVQVGTIGLLADLIDRRMPNIYRDDQQLISSDNNHKK